MVDPGTGGNFSPAYPFTLTCANRGRKGRNFRPVRPLGGRSVTGWGYGSQRIRYRRQPCGGGRCPGTQPPRRRPSVISCVSGCAATGAPSVRSRPRWPAGSACARGWRGGMLWAGRSGRWHRSTTPPIRGRGCRTTGSASTRAGRMAAAHPACATWRSWLSRSVTGAPRPSLSMPTTWNSSSPPIAACSPPATQPRRAAPGRRAP